MKKKFLLIILVLTFSCQFIVADSLPFYQAVDGLRVYQVNRLKREIDGLALNSAVAQQSDLKAARKLIKKYNLGQGIEEELEFNIAIANLVDKMRLANRIKDMGYAVEQNATFLAARRLYLATLKAKLDCELAQLQYDNRQAQLTGDVVKRDNGMISEIDFALSQSETEQAANDLALAKIEYDRLYGKLKQLLGNDVSIAVEQPRLSELASEDYYYSTIDNRFEIARAQIQIDIVDLDLPFYSDKYLVVRNIRTKYGALLREKNSYQLEIERQQFLIKKEIQQAMLDVKQSISEIENLQIQLADLRSRLNQMETLYAQGLISRQMRDDFKVNLKRMENGYYLKCCQLNNQRIALGMAVSVGPAY